jgi:hypothetical protein
VNRANAGVSSIQATQTETDMNIVKSRGGMVAVLAALSLAAVTAFAQAPGGGAPGGPPRGMGGGMGMGMGGPADRPTTIERQGLNDPALNLTAAQKTEIDKVVDGYLASQKTLAEKYPMTPGSPPSADAMAARTKAREDFTAALGKVLNDAQRKTWEAARAARGPGMGGGMRGGPGGAGGPGGPPPAR